MVLSARASVCLQCDCIWDQRSYELKLRPFNNNHELAVDSYNERMRSSIAQLQWVAVVLAGILLTGALAVNCRVEIPPVLAAQDGRIIPSDPNPLGPRVAGNDPIHDQIEQVQHAQIQKQLIEDTDKLLALANS